MNYPTDLKFTQNDEWLRVEGNTGTAGITHYAQEQLSDIVFVELPAVGDNLQRGQVLASVESVKAAAEVYIPVAGTITEVNEALSSTPETVNQDPHGNGWIARFTIANPDEVAGLMDAAAYEKFVAERTA
jgi:glycine cleavage system H protein